MVREVERLGHAGARQFSIFWLWRGLVSASYSSMKRMLFALALSGLVSLAGCATDDDDPFPDHSSATANSDVPVAGAATPARDDSRTGWKW